MKKQVWLFIAFVLIALLLGCASPTETAIPGTLSLSVGNSGQFIVGDTVVVTVKINQPSQSNFSSVKLMVNSQLLAEIPNGTNDFTYKWVTTPFKAGDYELKVHADGGSTEGPAMPSNSDTKKVTLSKFSLDFKTPGEQIEFFTGKKMNIVVEMLNENFKLRKLEYFLDSRLIGYNDFTGDAAIIDSLIFTPIVADIGEHTVSVKAHSSTGMIIQKNNSIKFSHYGIILDMPEFSQHWKNSTIDMVANVQDQSKKLGKNRSVTKVNFTVNGILAYTDDAAPYSFGWNTTPTAITTGEHTVVATGVSNYGNEFSDTIKVLLSKADLRINNPVSSEEYLAMTTIPVMAELVENDFQFNNINVYVDGILKDSLTQAPFTYNWNPVMTDIGNHTIKVKAVSKHGLAVEKTCEHVQISFYGVNIDNPNNAQYMKGEIIPLTATVVDQSKNRKHKSVAKVDFYVDNKLVFTDNTTPYSFDWDTRPSSISVANHEIKVVATSNLGKLISDTSNIVLSKADLQITNPVENGLYVVGSPLNLQANFTQENFNLHHINFYINDVKADSFNVANPSYSFRPIAGGNYTFKALAVSNYGKVIETVRNFSVNDAAMEITKPSDNSSYYIGGNVEIEASVNISKNAQVEKVEFFLGNEDTSIGSDVSAPFKCNFSTDNKPAGLYKIIAKAIFANGPTISDTVKVNLVAENIKFTLTTPFSNSGDDIPRFVYQHQTTENYLIGYTNGSTMSIKKLDKHGTVILTNNFNDSPGEIMSADTTNYGGYIIAYSSGTGVNRKTGVIKLNSDLVQVWNKDLDLPNTEDWPVGVKQTDDNGYLVVCNSINSVNAKYNPRLIKLYSTGNQVWESTDTTKSVYINSFEPTDKNSCKVAGYVLTQSKLGGNDFYVATLSRTGLASEHIYGGTGDDRAYGLDGKIAVGKSDTPSGVDMWIVDTSGDSESSPVWDMTIQNFNTADEAHSVAKTNDGGFIMAGLAGNDLSLAKITPNKRNKSLYNIEWAKTGTHPDINFTGGIKKAEFVKATKDGGFIVLGSTTTSSNGLDIWLMKLDVNGITIPQAAKKRK